MNDGCVFKEKAVRLRASLFHSPFLPSLMCVFWLYLINGGDLIQMVANRPRDNTTTEYSDKTDFGTELTKKSFSIAYDQRERERRAC